MDYVIDSFHDFKGLIFLSILIFQKIAYLTLIIRHEGQKQSSKKFSGVCLVFSGESSKSEFSSIKT